MGMIGKADVLTGLDPNGSYVIEQQVQLCLDHVF